ncbi:MAG: tetratricopeptide repeat protein [Planctomycetes bacterium]|nr:tetratricopeptide repeat protein [Planctomycetota bacterium]
MLTKARIFAAFALCTVLASCSSERPLHMVRSDGEFAAKTGDYPKAINDLGEYIRRKPEAHDVRYELAKAYIDAGQPRQAIEELTVCLDTKPLNDDYLDAMARALYDAGERDALTLRLRQNASERGRISDYIRLGKWSARLGNADEAKEALLTAAKLDGGNNLAPQLALADFYGGLNDRKNQVRRIRMAYFIAPMDAEVLKRIAEVGETPGPTFALKPEELTFDTPRVPAK